VDKQFVVMPSDGYDGHKMYARSYGFSHELDFSQDEFGFKILPTSPSCIVGIRGFQLKTRKEVMESRGWKCIFVLCENPLCLCCTKEIREKKLKEIEDAKQKLTSYYRTIQAWSYGLQW